jgi:hypothetical protein
MDETYAAFDAKSNSKMDLANSEKEWRPLPDRVKPFYTSMQWCKHVRLMADPDSQLLHRSLDAAREQGAPSWTLLAGMAAIWRGLAEFFMS